MKWLRDNGDKIRLLMGLVILALIAFAEIRAISAVWGTGGGREKSVPDELPRAALEWTRVEPVGDMTDISHECYRVMDKETGQRWWVIDRGSWGAIVLKVDDADE